MALPKRKTSQVRKRIRRSHINATPPTLMKCPQCHSPKLPHNVCPTCGTYNGREVITTKVPKKKTE